MQIFVEEKALPYSLTQEIIKKFPNYQIIPSYEAFQWEFLPEEKLVSLGKKRLFILEFKGDFIKPCPGTKKYLCCGYNIFHIGEGCPLDCSYCILQVYLNRPGLKVWGNLIEDGFKVLENFLRLRKNQGKITRIGTGEFTDSLALERITQLSEKLIYFWKEKSPYGVLELKTKIALTEEFFSKFEGDPRIIFAWSVNTERIIATEEKGTAPLWARLESAKKAAEKGFSVAFHFDPIIFYPGAEAEYPQVLATILHNLPHNKIAWISLGTLRYPKILKEIAQKRFPHTTIYSYEFIEGLDQKKRYYIEIRKALYQAFGKLIKETLNDITYYFCMESERIWEEVLGIPLKSSEEVAQRLDRVALRLCSL